MIMPTNKKVIDLLKPVQERNTDAQRDALVFLKRYLRGLNAEKLRKALWFLTGAKFICVNKIEMVLQPWLALEDGQLHTHVAHYWSYHQLMKVFQSLGKNLVQTNPNLWVNFWCQ